MSALSQPQAQFPLVDFWVKQQLTPWLGKHLDSAQLLEAYTAKAAQHLDVFVYQIQLGQVHLLPKPNIKPPLDPQSPEFFLASRAILYQMFFRDVVKFSKPDLNCLFAMSMADMCKHDDGLPWFTFQKARGASSLLMPDVDFLGSGYYNRLKPDALDYLQKQNRAVFVGSTTGARHTVESVSQLSSERLRLAVHFKDHPDVNFYLPTVAQCVDQQATEAIAQLGVAGRTMSFEEQCQSRFLLSVDGNGATCSRVFKALKSNSVLVKFDSAHQLFYFDGLRPYVEYIPVSHPGQVPQLIEAERREPGYFEPIAMAGQQFAKQYLQRDGLLAYAGALLDGYGRLLNSQK